MPEAILATMHQTAKLGEIWCEVMHDAPMWPIHGEYQCRTCGRHYPVPWAAVRLAPLAIEARLRPVGR